MESLGTIIHTNNAKKAEIEVLKTLDKFLTDRQDKIIGKRLTDAINEELRRIYGTYKFDEHPNQAYNNVNCWFNLTYSHYLQFDVGRLGTFYDYNESRSINENSADTRVMVYFNDDIESLKAAIKDKIKNHKPKTDKQIEAAYKKAQATHEKIKQLRDSIDALPYSWMLR